MRKYVSWFIWRNLFVVTNPCLIEHEFKKEMKAFRTCGPKTRYRLCGYNVSLGEMRSLKLIFFSKYRNMSFFFGTDLKGKRAR